MRSRVGPALITVVVLLAGCARNGEEGGPGASTAPPRVPSSATSPTTASSIATTGPVAPGRDVGPRPLPPTFVPLEVADFPRPADASCADNTRIVEVDDPSGLAETVRRAESGTTILVAPGTYRSDDEGDVRALVFDTPDVCLRSRTKPDDPTRAPVVIEPSGGQTTGIAIRASRVVIEGVVVRGFQAGIGFDADAGTTLQGVTIQSVAVTELTGESRDGIVSYGDNREVSGSPPAVDGLLLLGVAVQGADLGISCNAGPCAHWWLERVSVTGRQVSENSGADAFAIEEGRQIAVVDSRFERAAADGIDTKATDVVVLGARVTDVARNGIKLWSGGDVIDSVVNGSDADAALVGAGPARYRYVHVLVTRHGRDGDAYLGTWGYDKRRPVQLEIVNSIFADNAPGGFFVPPGSTVSIRHTIFDDPDAKLVDIGDDRSLGVADLDELVSMGWAADVVVADPRLVDPAAGDVSTAPGSPARDAAEPVAGLARDLVGGPRVVGAGPDIGPVESPTG
ncbi:MAG: choice-of-anchor Q domain-containing protein [Acidimicrobiales bacterium]